MMIIRQVYEDQLPINLEDDEWLLKVYEHKAPIGDYNLGFLSKLKKTGELPIAFEMWKPDYRETIEDFFLIKEKFRPGWEITTYRTGKSQDWVVVTSPEKIRLEIYMDNFFELMLSNSIVNGELIGDFKWHSKTLIKA